MEEERTPYPAHKILEMLDQGEIGVDEAERLLQALNAPAEEAMSGPEADAAMVTEGPARAVPEMPGSHWRQFWIWPMLAGGIVLLAGAMILGFVYATGAAAGWRVCGWLPMILGLIVAGLAWWSRTATWLHLRVHEANGSRVAISLPLPLTLAAWVLRIARPYVPQLRDTGIDELILALRDGKMGDEPLFIDVQDGEEGEHVQIYIG